MFRDREQRVLVVKTLFGAFNHANWIDDENELTEEAIEAHERVQKGQPSGLSHSGEWMFTLAMSLWDNETKIKFGKFYHLDTRNRMLVFRLLFCFSLVEEQSFAIEEWLSDWSHLR